MEASLDEQLSLEQVREAAEALKGTAHRTPLLPAELDCARRPFSFYLKAENLQRTGSFKLRGAFNRIRQLTPEQKQRGVVAASAGNHGQGVALAAAQAGAKATIFMPRHAPLIKVDATEAYGAEVKLVGDSFDEAQAQALTFQQEQQAVFVHAFDDPAVIAGQGTIGLEIIEDLPQVAAVVVPIGGGGLISGVALALKSINPGIRIIGVQPQGAGAVHSSRAAGRLTSLTAVRTIADGLAVKGPSELTFRLIQRYVDDVVLVDDDEIVGAMVYLLEHTKLLAEGAGATAVAAVLYGKISLSTGPTVAIVSGGNIDINFMARAIERGLLQDGRYLRLTTVLHDRPGALQQLAGLIAGLGANIIAVNHDRLEPSVSLDKTIVRLIVETRNRAHAAEVVKALTAAGYSSPVE